MLLQHARTGRAADTADGHTRVQGKASSHDVRSACLRTLLNKACCRHGGCAMPCPVTDWHGNSCRATLACHTQHPRACTTHLLLLLDDGGSQGSSHEGHMKGHRGQGRQQGQHTCSAAGFADAMHSKTAFCSGTIKACTLYG